MNGKKNPGHTVYADNTQSVSNNILRKFKSISDKKFKKIPSNPQHDVLSLRLCFVKWRKFLTHQSFRSFCPCSAPRCAVATKCAEEQGKSPALRDERALLTTFTRAQWATWELNSSVINIPVLRLHTARGLITRGQKKKNTLMSRSHPLFKSLFYHITQLNLILPHPRTWAWGLALSPSLSFLYTLGIKRDKLGSMRWMI